MTEKFIPYGGMANLINSLESEQEIKLFLSKYKKWYIQERHLSKNEAENQIKMDVMFYIRKFLIKEPLAKKLANALGIS